MELIKQAGTSRSISWAVKDCISNPNLWEPSTSRGRITPIPMPRLLKSRTSLSFLPESNETKSMNNTELWRLVLLEQLRLVRMQQHEIIDQRIDILGYHQVSLYELDLLAEISRVLQERSNEIEKHKHLLLHVADLKQKVRRQKIQINQTWQRLIHEEQREINFLNAEKDNLEIQIKNDHISGSKDTLHKPPSIDESKLNNSKGNKPPPSRMGNYTIMAKRLQGEIKHLEQNAHEMKARLQTELERKASIETRVKEMRSSLTLHRRQDPYTAPTTPLP